MARPAEFDLSVQIEAKIDRLEKQMRRADQIAAGRFTSMQRNADKAAKAMEDRMASSATKINASLANIGKGALGGIAGALAIGGLDQLVGQYRDTVRAVATIGNEARRAGLSTKAFQELSHVAEQTRIPMDALIDGMKELNLRADEFVVTGAGSAAEAFRRIGFDATTLEKKLEDPSALLVEIVERMQKLDKAAQIRVADELFGGTGGEQFVELLREGGAGIRRMIADANDLGLVLDENMIQKADEIDRKFALLSSRVGTGLKTAIIEATEALGDFLDQFRETQNQGANTLRDRIGQNLADQEALKATIAELRRQQTEDYLPALNRANEPEIALRQAELDALSKELDKLQTTLDHATGKSGASLDRLSSAADTAAGKLAGITPPPASARQVETASMAALGRFNSAEARTIAKQGMLDLIGYAEGTDKGRGYNETLGYGKFTGGDVNLTQMTLKEVRALQRQMLAHPANTFNSSAVGRYQIVGKTLESLMGEMGLSGDEFFSPALQDRMAQQLLRRRGNDVGGLRNEWEGLRRVPDGAITTAMGVTTPQMPGRDEGVQTKIDKNRELATSYREIVNAAVASIANGQLEQTTLGMTATQAAKLRYEQELLNEASRAGIALTPEQRQQFSELATAMAEVETATAKAVDSQEQLRAAQDFLAGGISGFFSSIITGSASVEEALQRMLASLAEAAIQAALFGQGPLGGLFGGGAGILGKLFGFSTGGPVQGFASGGHVRGPGSNTSDSIPAMLSDGEYVINSRATAKHRALLDAINAGHVPAFAEGGIVGVASRTAGASSSPHSQNITISPNVTVNAQGGTQDQNADLARQTAKAVEDSVRQIVVKEITTQMKPGGIFRGGR